MKKHATLYALLAAMVIFSLTACNLPTSKPTVTPTLAVTNTFPPPPPSATPLLPTDTLAPPPSDTPLPPPPTDTQVPPTRVPPTATRTAAPTAIKPIEGDKFEGTFEYGTLTLRIGANGNWIVPKQVTVKKAPCEGGKFSDHISFEPPPSFPIEDGQFSFVYEGFVTISGVFTSAKRATGSIRLALKSGGKNCNIGPSTWIATAP
ncbi:MAG: hypothetical protein AB1894_25910 [Chloroflexota bacterium]